MEALTLLEARMSRGDVTDPAPDAAAIEHMMRAALRAPDHKGLQPYRFLIIEGEARVAFGERLLAALIAANPAAEQKDRDKARNGPLRAPMILVGIACLQDHPAVPAVEQRLAAGCAVHAVLIAAQALGYGGLWRTGPLAHNAQVAAALGLAANEEIIAFIYLGTPLPGNRRLQDRAPAEIIARWNP